MAVNPINRPFDEAINYFKNKIQLPSSGYADVVGEQHSHGFMVAGASHDALVEDFYNAIQQGMKEGAGYPAFKARFDEIAAKHDWAYNGSSGTRSKIIYETNISQSYNAGKYKQMWGIRDLRPHWQYIHNDSPHPRAAHQQLHGKIYAADDPFWNFYFPKNGWGCKCGIRSLSQVEAERTPQWVASGQKTADVAPPVEFEDKVIGITGSNPRTVRTPVGCDPGFGYNPGKAWLEPHTVPPLQGYEAVLKTRDQPWPTSIEVPPLPIPTAVKSSILLPYDIDPAVAVEDFLSAFGADLETGVVFEDAAHVPVAITKKLFEDGNGDFKWLAKPEKAQRLQSITLLAMAIIEPDEIWWAWEQDYSHARENPDAQPRWRLKRRYLRAFEINESAEFGIAAFEWGSNGWAGSTAFTATQKSATDRLAYFTKQRVGRLIYKKKGS
jgi:SPP1 gp7 family putative phage head morphogenesis protein